MRERVGFIAAVERNDLTFAEICERFWVSRKTGYKWWARFVGSGPAGLEERPRRPHRSPNAAPRRVAEALEELRRRHPSWGAGKLLTILEERHPAWHLPTRSTGCALLKRAGLVRQRRRRLKVAHPGPPLSQMSAPNAVWSADFKGQFKTRDGVYCYPLTVSDGFSRYLFACQGLLSPCEELVRPVFTRLFEEYGLPRISGTDNGSPFASTALGTGFVGSTTKSVLTKHSGSASPPVYPNARSDPFPRRCPRSSTPGHFATRYVSENGGIRWKKCWVNVTTVLAHEWVGLEEAGDPLWDVYFSRLRLSRLDERRMRIEDPHGRWTRWEVLPMSPDNSVTYVPD